MTRGFAILAMMAGLGVDLCELLPARCPERPRIPVEDLPAYCGAPAPTREALTAAKIRGRARGLGAI